MASTEKKTDRKVKILKALNDAARLLSTVARYGQNALLNLDVLRDDEVQAALTDRQLASSVAAIVSDLVSIGNEVVNYWRDRAFATVVGYSPDNCVPKSRRAKDIGIKPLPYIPKRTGKRDTDDGADDKGAASKAAKAIAVARERLLQNDETETEATAAKAAKSK